MATSKYDQNALHGDVAVVCTADGHWHYTYPTTYIRKSEMEKKSIDRNFSSWVFIELKMEIEDE